MQKQKGAAGSESKQNSKRDSEQYLQHINEELYTRNAELAVRNKTLSLLRDLYNITLDTIASRELGQHLVKAISKTFSFELVGIFTISDKVDALAPVAFSLSEHLKKEMATLDEELMNIKIMLSDSSNICTKAVTEKQHIESLSLFDAWKPINDQRLIEKIQNMANIRSINVFPLVHNKKAMGVLMIAFDRTYSDLSHFEQESIESVAEVITIALVKSMLYDELRVANNRLQKLDKTKSEFLSIASHQLRTPISGIKGYLSMILEGDFGSVVDKQKEIIKSVYDNTERLNGLVNDFLDVSRIERGKLVMEREQTDISEMVQSTVKNFQPVAASKGLRLEYVPPKTSVQRINVDANKLRQVVMNLIDNAIKYTIEGFIHVSLDGYSDHLRVCVKDTGVGLEPAEAKHLFKPFVRATDATKSNATGSGLGLYVARKIVQYHGGKVWAESEGKGKGSNFCMEVPYDQTKVPEPEPEPYLE